MIRLKSMLTLPLLRPSRAFSSSSSSPSPFTWQEEKGDDVLKIAPEDVFRAGVRHHHICNTAFPIAHRYSMVPYRVPRLRDQAAIERTLVGSYGSLSEMMLYVHVPFCNTRCQFCEYTVVDPKVGRVSDVQQTYFDAMIEEMRMYDDVIDTKSKKLVGFDIGGGTPSMAHTSQIERVMEAVKRHYNCDTSSMEISIETTPKIAASDPAKIKAYYDLGIRRISMGVQTTDLQQARLLSRDDANTDASPSSSSSSSSSPLHFLHQAVHNIRAAGFQSFNVDLMYGFPIREGRPDPWAQTVLDAMALGPDHVTLYRMRYKGTAMAHLAPRVTLDQVNKQEKEARELLFAHGYHGMIGKNTYSRVNSGCSDYLDRRVVRGIPYIGMGLGAQSFSHHSLQYNLGAVTKKMDQYIRSVELGRLPVQDLYHLSRRAAMGKFCSVSFYYGGIDLEAFADIFHTPLSHEFGDELAFLLSRGLMVRKDGRVQLTELGKSHLGGVIAMFYSPSVKKHITSLEGGEAPARDLVDCLPIVTEPLLSLDPSPAKPSPSPSLSSSSPSSSHSPFASYALPPPSAPLLRAAARLYTTSSRKYSTSASPLPSPASTAEPSSSPAFEFGNILFGGACNQKCPFCIGHSLPESLSPPNLRVFPPANIHEFIEKMRETNTRKVIFTGTRTDPQLYKHEEALTSLLRSELPGLHISLHTNGLLAARKPHTFRLYDSVTISLNSFRPETYRLLHGVREMPSLPDIVKLTSAPIKLSCIVTPQNWDQVDEYIQKAKECGIRRIAFRYIYKNPERFPLFDDRIPVRHHFRNPVYSIDEVEVTHWIFEDYSGNSLNLFADGTLSDKYLLTDAVSR